LFKNFEILKMLQVHKWVNDFLWKKSHLMCMKFAFLHSQYNSIFRLQKESAVQLHWNLQWMWSRLDSFISKYLNIDSNNRLKTTLYDKYGDCNFAIVNIHFHCSNIPLSRTYGVHISQLIQY
jgi:hypothetical protein